MTKRSPGLPCWSCRRLVAAALVLAVVRPAAAQDLSLNYDNLSFFEEPVAFEALGFTITYNQLVDQPVSYSFEEDDVDFNTRVNFRATAERQLANALTVGAAYFGAYERTGDPEFEDNWGIFGRGVWGRLSLGEVTGEVREATRRMRGAGNAELEFDDAIGILEDDLGAAYSLRMSAFTLNVAIDDDAHTDLGVTYDRPGRRMDYRVTARYVRSETPSIDRLAEFDTHTVVFLAGIAYGSFVTDISLGYERLSGSGVNGDRFFFSGGQHYKVRRLTLSAEGHLGTIDGDREVSGSLGARFDIARGLSINLGYNFATSDASIDGLPIRNKDISEVLMSLRYEL